MEGGTERERLGVGGGQIRWQGGREGEVFDGQSWLDTHNR